MLTAKQQEHFEKVLEKAKITPNPQALCKNCHRYLYGVSSFELINPATSPIIVHETEKYVQVVFFIKCPHCNTIHIASYDVNPQTYQNYCQPVYIRLEVITNLEELVNTYKSPSELFQGDIYTLQDEVVQHYAIHTLFKYQNILSARLSRKQLCNELYKLRCSPAISANFLNHIISSIGSTEEQEAVKQLDYLSTLISYRTERPAIQPVLHLITGIPLDKLSEEYYNKCTESEV